MLKTLAAQIKQYKKSTILTPIFAALEVVMEVLIPMAMARLVKCASALMRASSRNTGASRGRSAPASPCW